MQVDGLYHYLTLEDAPKGARFYFDYIRQTKLDLYSAEEENLSDPINKSFYLTNNNIQIFDKD
jgi:hypothetical protein